MNGTPQEPKPGLAGRRTSLVDVLVLQRSVFNASLNENIKASDLASLARAWDILEDRKRILRGRPLPGSLKPVKKEKSKRQASQTFLEPTVMPELPETEGISFESQTVPTVATGEGNREVSPESIESPLLSSPDFPQGSSAQG